MGGQDLPNRRHIFFTLHLLGWPNEINNIMESRSRGCKCDVDFMIINFLFRLSRVVL